MRAIARASAVPARPAPRMPTTRGRASAGAASDELIALASQPGDLHLDDVVGTQPRAAALGVPAGQGDPAGVPVRIRSPGFRGDQLRGVGDQLGGEKTTSATLSS